jgi:VWFA-related protein
MHQFIERNLGENDLMAVVNTGGRTDAAQEFTNSKRLLLAAVDKFMGRKLVSATVARNEQYFRQAGVPGRVADPDEQERAYNAQSTMCSLKEIAEWMSGLRGRRKTIIYVSEGIDYDITDVIRQYDSTSNSASALIDDIRQTINAAARSNVAIYAIDPRGLTNLGDISIGVASWADAQGGAGAADPATPTADATGIGARGLQNELFLSQMNLRALAEETNGYAAVNSNDFTGAFDRIVRDNSSYYVLAYYPAQNRRDGKFHKIQVRVSRPGVTVRARRGYIAPRVRSVSTKATPGASSSPAVTEALNSPIGVSDLAMRVFAAPFKGTAPNASVLFGVEMSGRDLSLDSGAKIEIAYFAVDASGKTKAGKTETVTLNLRPESKVRVTENGLRFLSRVDLPPGRYTLRVAARDVTGGKVGSVSYDLEVPDFAKNELSADGVALRR